jgi:predicted nuclease with RNAse H fold
MKIYLEIITEPVQGVCAVSRKKVTFKGPYGFFAEGKMDRPVREAEALKKGFTVKPKTLKKMRVLMDMGLKFEEVQRASHEEFAAWQALT